MILDAVKIWLIGIFDVKITILALVHFMIRREDNSRLTAQRIVGTSGKLPVDRTDLFGNM